MRHVLLASLTVLFAAGPITTEGQSGRVGLELGQAGPFELAVRPAPAVAREATEVSPSVPLLAATTFAREEGSFQWRGRVDGVDDIMIRGEAVRIHHIAAKPIQNQDYRFSEPLPRSEVEMQLNVVQGRGVVRLVQEPASANDYTAIVRVDDGDHSGDSDYEFELVWSRRERSGGWGSGSNWPDSSWPRGGAWEDVEYFRWRGRVDGIDEIWIQGRSVRIDHIAAQPIQDQDYRFTAPLPETEVDMQLNVVRGRGRVRLTQEPSYANDYTAVVRIDDSKDSGDSDYEIELGWTKREERSSSSGSFDSYGFFRWRGRVDIGAEIHIRGNQHEVKDMGGQGSQELKADFGEPLPARAVPVSLEKTDGRGRVELVETPNPGNDYTAVVRIEDPKTGSDTYEFELTWPRR